MQLTQYSNPQKFLREVRPFLEEKEALNNLMLGTVFRFAHPDGKEMADKGLMFAIEEKGQIVYAAMRMYPLNVIVTSNDTAIELGNALLVNYLRENDLIVPGVIGRKQCSTDFANQWVAKSGGSYRKINDMGVYRLEKVIEVAHPKGQFRLAKKEEEPLMIDWLLKFEEELFGELRPERVRKIILEKFKKDLLYVWELNGEVVSMASGTRPTENCMTISGVYTPAEHRRKGYARSCVAKLSQTMLDKGYKLCALFTDLKNPTSNKIYREIGYYQVGEFASFRFQ